SMSLPILPPTALPSPQPIRPDIGPSSAVEYAHPSTPPTSWPSFRPASALKRYPNAPVIAPLANLPPPATEPTPPSTALATSFWEPLMPPMNGAPAAPTAAASAPEPHPPPEATEKAQPTAACPATFAAYTEGSNLGESKA